LQVKDNETSTMETVQGIQQTIAVLLKVSTQFAYSSIELQLVTSLIMCFSASDSLAMYGATYICV